MPSRRALLCLAIIVGAIGCHGGPTSTPPRTTTTAQPSTPSSSMPSPASVPSASTALPSGLASPFGEELQPGDVPLTDLVPAGTEPTGSWFPRMTAGDAIVVAWQAPGGDPFRTDRGFVVWRHTGDPTLWRPVFAATYPAERHPVLGITAVVADVTGDGSQDTLVFAETGGSGACGIYTAVDATTGTAAFRRSVCDATIKPSSDAAGLVVTEAVYAHGDPHCCPSATRTTVLQRDPNGEWRTISVTTVPT
jgi:hypothetical protein